MILPKELRRLTDDQLAVASFRIKEEQDIRRRRHRDAELDRLRKSICDCIRETEFTLTEVFPLRVTDDSALHRVDLDTGELID